MNLDINPYDLLLPVYHEFFDDRSYYSILRGSRGSGKSRNIALKLIYRCLSEKNHRIVVIRNELAKHANSTVPELCQALEQYGLKKIAIGSSKFGYEVYKAPSKISIPALNSEFIFLGMDNPEKLKSLSGVTAIWFEEVTDIKTQDEFDSVMAGFRPANVLYEQIYMSFNPVSELHWIKKRFFDDNPDKLRTYPLKTTYKDNPTLSTNYCNTLENLKFTNPAKYQVDVLGNWGTVQSGQEYYKGFNEIYHVDDNNDLCIYNPNLALHVSFDFNVTPHMTMILAQQHGKGLRIVGEIIAKHPYNTVHGICNLFKEKFFNHETGLFIYGDASGKARSQSDGSTHFNIIMSQLHSFKPILRVPSKNPSPTIRGQFINEILGRKDNGIYVGYHNITVLISKDCTGLITDLKEIKEDESGNKIKEKAKLPGRTRVGWGTYERLGHWSDALDYLLCEMYKIEYSIFSNNKGKGISTVFVPHRLGRKYNL